jgi:crotonobetainyl-CoA:carnitine CoA-transferase CaiB-like acyl-CoA transferase
MADPWVTSHDLSLTREHDEIGLVTTCGPVPRLSRTPIRAGWPASKPGSDAYDVLSDIGLSDREIEALLEAGVVRVDGVAAG